MCSDIAVVEDESLPSLLVIDDDAAVRKNICAFLTDSGFRVIEAENGKIGVELYASEKPDLVLCDLRMPDVDGLDVIRGVAAGNTNTPVIVISGVGELDDVVQALRLGAADYLMKPIKDLAVLEHSIRRGLKQAQLIEENIRYRSKLENINQQLRQSLDLLQLDQQAGRHVQIRLLPRTPFTTSSLLCNHKIVPSLYLSGDFVDYWEVGEGQLMFYIADVSGHGASSAFVTVLLKYLAKDIVKRQFKKLGEISIGAIMSQLNRELVHANLQKHVTAFIGLLDTRQDLLRYSAAGHYPMPIIGNDGDYRYLEARSFPIGIREDANYEDSTVTISDSFTINLFSDGVLELMDLPDLDAKEAHLLSVVASSEGRFQGVFDELKLGSVADAPDDVALLTIEYTKP